MLSSAAPSGGIEGLGRAQLLGQLRPTNADA
jgi:hypothetical protein